MNNIDKAVEFKTQGVCARNITYELKDNKIYNLQFERGCDGNLKAIAALLEGTDKDEVIPKIENITCGKKKSSCSAQLAISLKEQ